MLLAKEGIGKGCLFTGGSQERVRTLAPCRRFFGHDVWEVLGISGLSTRFSMYPHLLVTAKKGSKIEESDDRVCVGGPCLPYFPTMRLIPLCYCPTLSEEEIYRHECSDRIWVPQHVFERWLLAEDVGSVVIVSVEGVPACMYAPHGGPSNVIYAPMWMCEELGTLVTEDDADAAEDHYITLERLQPAMCTFLKVQPHTSAHLPAIVGGAGGDEMPEDTLSRAFEEYTCLREGHTMMLHLPCGNRMFVTVAEALPQAQGPLCIRNTEIAMDLLEPLDTPPAPEPVPEPETAPEPEPVQETREERRERLYKAAMARLQTT